MAQIVYQIIGGSPDFTASIVPAVAPNQILHTPGIYSFDNIPDGMYILSVIDSNGCKYTVTVDLQSPVDCILDASVSVIDCTLDGNAVIVILPCERPEGLTFYSFVTGYTILTTVFVSTNSSEEACAALNFLINTIDPDIVVTKLYAYAYSISSGSITYLSNNTNDCSCVPDGWYFTAETAYYGNVFHVEGCKIIEILNCAAIPSTSTTSTSTSTSTTTTTIPPIVDCGTIISMNGKSCYPFTQEVELGSDTGICYLSYDTHHMPDRVIVTWDGTVQIDTGYVGDQIYDYGSINRNAFTIPLTGLTDPITSNTYPDFASYSDDGYPRIAGSGAGMSSFIKGTASPTSATVDVYAPMDGTIWGFVLQCPSSATTTSTTTNASTTSTTTNVPTTSTTTTTEVPPYIYGQLYNWYAASNPLIAPGGWHVPYDSEWVTLFVSLGSTAVVMKSAGDLNSIPPGLWTPAILPGVTGTNTSGLTINPSGVVRSTGICDGRHNYGNFWGAGEKTSLLGEYRNFGYNSSNMYTNSGYYDKHYGFDIRLVKNDIIGYPNIGDTGTLTDIDGNVYSAKRMPDGKVWMTQNLRVSKYNIGTTIPVDPADWSIRTEGAMHTYVEPGVTTTTTTTITP